jgi:YbbR domain-containing protein
MTRTALARALSLRLSRADLARVGASLVLAVLLWGWVTNAEDPEVTRTFADVPIQVDELPGALEVVGTIPDVTVRVTGPRSEVIGVTADEVEARLDLDGIEGPGDYTVEIEVRRPGGAWSVSSTPSRLPIRVEESITELFVIEPTLSGTVDSTRQVTVSVDETSEITVVGPRSSVDRVARVIAPVSIGNETRNFSVQVAAEAIDAEGRPIPEVSLTPEFVSVNVAIDARGKRVAVLAQIEGSPASGYEVVDRTIVPDTILVDGPEEIVEQMISVSTEPIDIAGATETITGRVQITELPEGVQVIEPAGGGVDVVIQIRQMGVRQPLPAQRIIVVGLDAGLTASVSPDAVEVTVVAPEEFISRLTTSVLTVQINVQGLGPGTYELSPVVALPPNVTWVDSNPATVTVTIAEAPATPLAGQATPSPSP